MPEIGLKIALVELAFEMFQIAAKRQGQRIDPEPKGTGCPCMFGVGVLPGWYLMCLIC